MGGEIGDRPRFPRLPRLPPGTVSDLQTGIVQTTNYDLDFPCIGLIDSQFKVLGSQTLNEITNT